MRSVLNTCIQFAFRFEFMDSGSPRLEVVESVWIVRQAVCVGAWSQFGRVCVDEDEDVDVISRGGVE